MTSKPGRPLRAGVVAEAEARDQEKRVEASAARQGVICFCGAAKGWGRSFCDACWIALPGWMWTRLKHPEIKGFEWAYGDAKQWLREHRGKGGADVQVDGAPGALAASPDKTAGASKG